MSIPTLPGQEGRDVSKRKSNDFTLRSPSGQHLGFLQLNKSLPQEVAEKVIAILTDAKLEAAFIDGKPVAKTAEEFGF